MLKELVEVEQTIGFSEAYFWKHHLGYNRF